MFSLIACCPTLNVLFENDVKDKWGNREGIYTFQGLSDGMDYWVHADGSFAIWYGTSSSADSWRIGTITNLGSTTVSMYSSSNTLEKKCPNNEGYVWNCVFA